MNRSPRSGSVAGTAIAVALVLALAVVPVLGSATAGTSAGRTALDGPSEAVAAGGLHGNHLGVDPQVSTDGAVVVETLSVMVPAYVVLWTDDGGSYGEPVGHAAVNATGFRTDLRVPVDDGAWANWSEDRRLWAVLHRDDGNGEFDPESDAAMATRNPAAESSFAFGAGAAPVRVLASAFDVQAPDDDPQTTNGTIAVRRVELAADGHLVVRPNGGGEPVGTRHLAAGRHENVTVELNESFYAEQDRRFRVSLRVYEDDGDGAFGDGDRQVTVAGEPVGSTLIVRPGDGGDGPLINTPDGADVATPTATPPPTATTAAAETPATASGGDPPDGTAEGSTNSTGTAAGPGFGPIVTAVAAAIAALVAARRRADR